MADQEKVHEDILRVAAEKATANAHRVLGRPMQFYEANYLSTDDKLTLRYDTDALMAFPEEERESVEDLLVQIAVQAVQDALVEMQNEFVGLIVGNAKQHKILL